jgi:hypothetical protein
MERRDAIRSIALGVWGMVLLPGCDSGDTRESEKSGKLLAIDDIQANNLEAVVDTFLPATSTKGAVELQVDQFISRLIANCYPDAYIKEFIGYLDTVELWSERAEGRSFFLLGRNEREQILENMNDEEEPEAQKAFWELKEYCILGFTTSEYYLTQFTKYEMAPGVYEGCIPVPSGDFLI